MKFSKDISSEHGSPFHALCLTALIAVVSAASPLATAADLYDASAIPHVGTKAREAYYQLYLNAPEHKAFAIAPGGAWSWVSGQANEDQARQVVLRNCANNTQQQCIIYALNKQLVFSRSKWAGLWGPYRNEQQAASAQVGYLRGQRFPNLTFITPEGEKTSLSQHKGKLILLHFWGSWCPPCLRELPSLESFYRILQERTGDQVGFILLQVREPISAARAWLQKKGISKLPLHDSGVTDEQQDYFFTVSGKRIADRDIARFFPSSYVLDQNGLVLFSHSGPISDWTEYLAFFEHAVGEFQTK